MDQSEEMTMTTNKGMGRMNLDDISVGDVVTIVRGTEDCPGYSKVIYEVSRSESVFSVQTITLESLRFHINVQGYSIENVYRPNWDDSFVFPTHNNAVISMSTKPTTGVSEKSVAIFYAGLWEVSGIAASYDEKTIRDLWCNFQVLNEGDDNG